VPLYEGDAQFTIATPAVGTHKVIVAYAQQSGYDAAPPWNESFTVNYAPVNVALTPSSWYATVGTAITFQAAITSWSAGPPNAIGNVYFFDGNTMLAGVPVNSNGQASYTTSSLTAGTHTIKAEYVNLGGNYANGFTTATITLAQ